MILEHQSRKSCGTKTLVATIPLLITSLTVATMGLIKLNDATEQITDANGKLISAAMQLSAMQDRLEQMSQANETLARNFADLKVSLSEGESLTARDVQAVDSNLIGMVLERFDRAKAQTAVESQASTSSGAALLDQAKTKIMASVVAANTAHDKAAEQAMQDLTTVAEKGSSTQAGEKVEAEAKNEIPSDESQAQDHGAVAAPDSGSKE